MNKVIITEEMRFRQRLCELRACIKFCVNCLIKPVKKSL